MRIVFFIDILIGGGAGRSVVTLFKTINKLGYDAHLILIDPIIRTPIDEFKEKVHILNPERDLPKFKPIKHLILAKRLKQVVKKLNPSIFISNLYYADKITHLANIPNRFFCIRNTMSKDYFKFKKTTIEKIIKKIKIKNLYSNENLITVSKGLQKDITKTLGITPKSIQTIYNPFDIEYTQKMATMHSRYPKEPYLLHVGRYDIHQKRHDLLLKAYKLVNPPYKLYLLGKGDDKEKINKMIKEMNLENRVILAGFDENPFPWMKNSILNISTSDYEGFSRVIVESLIVHTPIVGTNCPYGVDEVLKDDLSPLLAKQGDVEDIAKKIENNLKNPIKIEKKHYEKFDAKNIAKEYINLAK